MKLIIFGPPGAGKGTYSAMIKRDYGLHLFVMGNELRAARDGEGELADTLRAFMGQGNLVPDKHLLEIVRTNLEGKESFILDGFPRTISQCMFLDSLYGNRIDAFIDLQVNEDLLIERAIGRGRSDDTEEIVQHRMEVFKKETAPVWQYLKARTNHIRIDGNGTIDDVYATIRQRLDSLSS